MEGFPTPFLLPRPSHQLLSLEDEAKEGEGWLLSHWQKCLPAYSPPHTTLCSQTLALLSLGPGPHGGAWSRQPG